MDALPAMALGSGGALLLYLLWKYRKGKQRKPPFVFKGSGSSQPPTYKKKRKNKRRSRKPGVVYTLRDLPFSAEPPPQPQHSRKRGRSDIGPYSGVLGGNRVYKSRRRSETTPEWKRRASRIDRYGRGGYLDRVDPTGAWEAGDPDYEIRRREARANTLESARANNPDTAVRLAKRFALDRQEENLLKKLQQIYWEYEKDSE